MLNHLAIIMDGNARWAEAKRLPVSEGHRQGAEAVRKTLKSCTKSGVKYLTIYAFSSENWKRPKNEISELMHLLRFYLGRELKEIHKNGVKVKIIGNREKLDKDIQAEILKAEELTKNNNKITFTIALSYGSRDEIIRAANLAAKEFAEGKIKEINEENFLKFLYTADIPEPDLLIRTAGEQRLSNFLLWQCAYTEFLFMPVLWPDFGEEHIAEAMQEFEKRERRYGARIKAAS